MGSAYYYFVASLPHLEFGNPPILSLQTFLSDCERLISPEDYTQIQKALGVDEGEAAPMSNPTTKSWQQFMNALRNQSAWTRATRAQKDPQPYLKGERAFEADIVQAISAAEKNPNPLEGELLIDRLRWQKLDELCCGHFFDLEALIIYALRLKILDRFEKMDSVRGQQIFEEYQRETRQLR
jgi:hypothetical protein